MNHPLLRGVSTANFLSRTPSRGRAGPRCHRDTSASAAKRLGHMLSCLHDRIGRAWCCAWERAPCGAASPCHGAFQEVYEHPWGTKTHTPAKLLRPRTIGNLFSDDRVPHRNDLMDQAPMQ